MTGGLSRRNGWTRLPARTRQRSWWVATMSATGGLAKQDRDLAEEVAPAERRPLLAVDDDGGIAVEDHVERRPGEALAQDALAFGVNLLLERVGDPFELRGGEVGEEREPRDLVDDLVAAGHGDAPSVAVCAQRTAHRQFCHRRGCRLTSRARRRSIIFVPRWRTR